ncbi:MAG: amino acid ABC transporter substrate-binding protein, partial [Candidatus Marinimicrobia bacterium]|nr:amino acid ABC transporter substrate-binding protein [Candidatus Neomarinimicrobiota bacterium]
MKLFKVLAVCVTVLAMSTFAMAGTLEDVKAKGFIQVGYNGSVAGFGNVNEKGVEQGLDVDCARAL